MTVRFDHEVGSQPVPVGGKVLNVDKMVKLSQIKQGKKAKIISFSNNDLFLKLMEMGCLPGEEVQVEQIAPLGDPISIGVAGYSLSLRLSEADAIVVEELA